MNSQWENLRANEKLVRKIMEKYKVGRIVQWKKAFAENPEWEKTLVGKDGDIQNLRIYANQLNKADGKVVPRSPRAELAVRRAAKRGRSTSATNGESLTIQGKGVVNGRMANFSVTVSYVE